MKSMRIILIVFVALLLSFLPATYAQEQFVTAEYLSAEDVHGFINSLANENRGMVDGYFVTIKDVTQSGGRAVVECEFCYIEDALSAEEKYETQNVIFERTPSGKWVHVGSGKYLAK